MAAESMSNANSAVRALRQLAEICDSGADIKFDCILCTYQVTVFPDVVEDPVKHFHLSGKDLIDLIRQAHEQLSINSEDFTPR